jgi:uncharacterized membrane protein YeaQ/YmgE (transglycosylase-associated protein family)
MNHLSNENLVLFLVVGLVAGWLAGKIMRGSGFGLVGDLVFGVVGAFVGVWLFGLLGISAGGLLGLLAAAVVGALLILFLLRLLRRGR